MDFKQGIIDKVQEGQLYEVFHTYDLDGDDCLDWEEFKTFVFVVGMQFLINHYEEEIIEQLFDWDNENNRVSFEEFIEFINERCKFENTPEQFEKDLEVLDDDQNGTAAIEDVVRVMKMHEKMDDEDINLFIKICYMGSKDAQNSGDLHYKNMKLPPKFDVKTAVERLYNK